MPARFFIGGALHERDRLVLARAAAAFGVSISDFIAWAVDQALDPGIADVLLARDFALPDPEPKPLCTSPGCEAPIHARGLCTRHVQRAYRTNEWAA